MIHGRPQSCTKVVRRSLATRAPGAEAPPEHVYVALTLLSLVEVEGADRELRKSRDATHLATDGPAPRRYDGHTTAARVRVAVFVRSEKSNALVGDGVPGFRRARRTSTALSVACSSLRQKPGEQLLCCSHTLHS